MPRQSQSSLSIAHIGPGARRLEPPCELGEIEAVIFRRTVAGVPQDHFSAEDVDVLCAYCRAIALERRASDELATATTIGGQASPWLAVYATAVRAISTLTVRLRLGPKARHPGNTRRLSKPVSTSYYDTMVLPADAQPRAPQGGPPGWQRKL
jgi:phage terminase small subunit